MKKPLLSFVIPVYNEEENIQELHSELKEVASLLIKKSKILDYEINETLGAQPPGYTISVVEGIVNNTWYSIFNGSAWSQNFTFTSENFQINQEIWDSLPEGAITIRIFANDNRGYVGFIDANILRVLPPDLTGLLIFIIIIIAFLALASLYGILYTRKSRKRLREKDSAIKELEKFLTYSP